MTVEAEVGTGRVTFTTGRLAKQADGAVVVRSGDTAVLATAVGRTEAREGTDFFPLTVDVEEKMYAAGKIPGGFFKREGRASEKAILNARMIDRPIRPLFPKGFRNDIQVIATVLSVDGETRTTCWRSTASRRRSLISPLPFFGPVGAVRVGLIEGELVVNPAMPEMEELDLDLIVCGTADAITMVEAGARRSSEDTLLDALELAHNEIKKLCDAQLELGRQVGKPKWYDPAVKDELAERYGGRFAALLAEHGLAGIAAAAAEAQRAELPPVAADAGEDDMVRRTPGGAGGPVLAEELRAKAVKDAVEEQFGDESRGSRTPSRTRRS